MGSTLANQPPMALVLGCDIGNCLAAVRALGRKKIPLAVTGADGGLVSRSRWYRPWPAAGSSQPEPGNLAQYLAAADLPAGGVLIPCTDDWVRAVSRLPAAGGTRASLCWSVPPADAAEACLDKARFAETLERLDLSRPRTWFPDRGQMPPAEALTGCFVKPCDSSAFSARFEAKGFRFHSAAEAEQVIEKCRAAGLAVIVQELIPGPATQHHFLDGFVDRHGNVSALFARHRLRSQQALGNSSCLVSIDPAVMREPAAELRRLLAAIGYRGVFSAEFKLDPRDNRFKFIEVNTRVWGDMGLALRCGVDVVEMMYLDAQGLAVPPVTKYKIGQHWVGLYKDRAAAGKLVREGLLTRSEWARQWKSATFDLLSVDDPRPAFYDAWCRARWRWERMTGRGASRVSNHPAAADSSAAVPTVRG